MAEPSFRTVEEALEYKRQQPPEPPTPCAKCGAGGDRLAMVYLCTVGYVCAACYQALLQKKRGGRDV